MLSATYDYIIYSDGGVAETGSAASAAIVEIKEQSRISNTGSKKHKIVCYLGEKDISVMEAEIFAGIIGLTCVRVIEKRIVIVGSTPIKVLWCCDNKVVTDAAGHFITKWQSNNWKNAQNKRVAYMKLWQDFLSLSKGIQLDVRHIKSHSGNRQNEMCDRACRWVQSKGESLLEQGEGKIGGQKNVLNAWLLLDMSRGLTVNALKRKIIHVG